MPRFAVLAKVGAPHGVKGDLKLHHHSEADLSAFSALWIQYPASTEWKPLPPAKIFSRGQLNLIHFDGWDDRDEARRFTNALVGVEADALPALDEEADARTAYWAELEGMSVVNQEGIVLGQVDHLFETGANDVMVVKQGARERLLPYVDQVIQSIDRDTRVITVDWGQDF